MSRLLLSVPLLLPSCQLEAPLEKPAWSYARPGGWGVHGALSVWNDSHADSTIRFDSNFGAQKFTLDTDLIGRFGAATELEYFVAPDLSLVGGFAHWVFEPEDGDGFLFEDVTSDEIFLGTRWLLPWCWGSEDRWRAFVELRFAYVPHTEFEAAIDLSSIGKPNPEYVFDGSDYWNLGLSLGLLRQLRDDLVLRGALLYEWPLHYSQDEVDLEFLPGYPLLLDTEIEPQGLIVLFGLSYCF